MLTSARRLFKCLTVTAIALFWLPVLAADIGNGADIVDHGIAPTVPACVTCHGARGQGGPGFPPLAGTGASYLLEQLNNFSDGKRQNAVMGPIARALNGAQRADVAAYFASLPNGLSHKPAADLVDPGAWFVLRGHMEEGVPACVTCHGPGSAGVGEHFPPIAALSADYIKEQIAAWKSGSRDPGPLGLMGSIAKHLTDTDVDVITRYYAAHQNKQ